MNYNEFINTIIIYKKISQIEKIGITDTALSNLFEFNFSIDKFFIYNHDGNELLSYHMNEDDKLFSKKNCFKNILTSLSLCNISEIFLRDKKIFIYNCLFYFIIVAKKNIKGSLIKFYLKFISNVFFNFIGGNDYYNENLNNISILFQKFFVKYLTNKFIKILNSMIFRIEQHHSSQIKFINYIIINCENNTIFFNLMKLLSKDNNEKFNKELTLNQILLHNLNKYKNYYSTKLTLLSTYPRLSFISTYLKVNNGIGIIQFYKSSKLSRNSSEYSEYELTFQKTQEDYLSCIPIIPNKNLNYIEKFILSYFFSINPKLTLYNNIKCDFPYFDREFLCVIDDSLKLRMTFDNLISYLNKKLYITLKNYESNSTINQNNLSSSNNKNKTNLTNLIIEKTEILNDLYPNYHKLMETKLTITLIDNNPNDKIVNNIFDEYSEISIIEQKKETEFFESLISNFKDKNTLISLNRSFIEETKIEESENKKDKIELLKSIQFKLINSDNKLNFSPIKNNRFISKTLDIFSKPKEKKIPIFFKSLINNNNDFDKNEKFDKFDISQFYGDKSSQEIFCDSPTFADLNKNKKKKN